MGSQSPLVTSPRARCSRLSPSLVRGAASEPWPRLVHGGKGSWSGLGQFSAQGTRGARGAGRAAAGTWHPLTGCPGPVPRARVEGRTDPNWPHTPWPQRRAARSLPHHAAGWGSAPRRPGTEASERPTRSPAPEAAGLGSVPGLPGQGSSGRREPLCHSVCDLGHVPCPWGPGSPDTGLLATVCSPRGPGSPDAGLRRGHAAAKPGRHADVFGGSSGHRGRSVSPTTGDVRDMSPRHPGGRRRSGSHTLSLPSSDEVMAANVRWLSLINSPALINFFPISPDIIHYHKCQLCRMFPSCFPAPHERCVFDTVQNPWWRVDAPPVRRENVEGATEFSKRLLRIHSHNQICF